MYKYNYEIDYSAHVSTSGVIITFIIDIMRFLPLALIFFCLIILVTALICGVYH